MIALSSGLGVATMSVRGRCVCVCVVCGVCVCVGNYLRHPTFWGYPDASLLPRRQG